MHSEMVKHFLFLFLSACGLTFLVHAQDQSGFISLDCGLPADSTYEDSSTGILYVSDANYIDTGVSENISALYMTNSLEHQFSTVRSFPQGTKNCYNLTPRNVSGAKYLLRARFMYGNYDAKNQLPQFDLYLGGSLALFLRYNVGSSTNPITVRFPDDTFDRIWEPILSNLPEISTSVTIGEIYPNDYKLPSVVMQTAVTKQNANDSIYISWRPSDPETQYYVYFHFSNIANQSQALDSYLNAEHWYGPFELGHLHTITIYNLRPFRENAFNFSLNRTYNSTLPPFINAYEVYTVKDLPQFQTDDDDVAAMRNIKSAYSVEKNWQGDPCVPESYLWEGLNCTFDGGYNLPRIISLDLSSSGLTGMISEYLFNLKELQYLDLSYNELTGELPQFLSQMQNLRVLNLTENNLTGTVPEDLIKRNTSGSLSLSVGGNLYLCTLEPCNNTNPNTNTTTYHNKKKNSVVIPVVASVAGVSVLLIASAIFCVCIRQKGKQRKAQPPPVANVSNVSTRLNDRVAPLKAKNQQLTYHEVLSITDNFQRIIGKGGFGTVYHGILDGTQVAVKMLSPSSVQGYKQFRAEAELLMRVHHRNLTILVGYCDEGEHMGLIYEYMANGSLDEHISDKSPNILGWETRLKIMLDAAQGLEYLHHGCRPPIIHRDVKSTNILLDEKFQAKLADFGLSKVFSIEGRTHVSTTVAGTPGYLDPEYYVSCKLKEKSDVYSFGVVLLEIITGRFPIMRNHEKTHISQWVSHMLDTKGDVRDLVDSRLQGEFDVNSVWKAVEVAMDCVSPTSSKRPFMNDVVLELKQCLVLQKAQMNRGYQTDFQDLVELVPLNIDSRMSPQAR